MTLPIGALSKRYLGKFSNPKSATRVVGRPVEAFVSLNNTLPLTAIN
jgi:hypothetical protein